jgi:predicted ArsR family transcriptional regulator
MKDKSGENEQERDQDVDTGSSFWWTREQVDALLANYRTISTREIAQSIGRSYEAVRYKARAIGLTGGARTQQIMEIADELGRSYDAVRSRMRRLELTRRNEYSWTLKRKDLL